jgi:hypothetical protein
MIYVLIGYISIVIFGCITYKIYKTKGYMFKKNDDDDITPFYILVFLPVLNILPICMIIWEMLETNELPINYELKYKTLTKMIVTQEILTKEQIQDLENAATLMDKLLM